MKEGNIKLPIFFITKSKRNKHFSDWTDAEDKMLLSLTSGRRINWKLVVNCLKNKSISKCKYRYFQLDPNISHGRWTEEEDQLLHRLVESYGYSWNFISKFIKNRSSKQIRSRYINYIFKGINKSQFTEEEDQIILNNFKLLKNNWIKYCNLLSNRSPRQIENRIKVLLRQKH